MFPASALWESVPAGPEGWEGVPNVSITDFSGFGRGTYTRQTNNTWHVADSFSKILNRHTLNSDSRAGTCKSTRRDTSAPTETSASPDRRLASLLQTFCWALPINTSKRHYK